VQLLNVQSKIVSNNDYNNGVYKKTEQD